MQEVVVRTKVKGGFSNTDFYIWQALVQDNLPDFISALFCHEQCETNFSKYLQTGILEHMHKHR